jgi:hypothetical protein
LSLVLFNQLLPYFSPRISVAFRYDEGSSKQTSPQSVSAFFRGIATRDLISNAVNGGIGNLLNCSPWPGYTWAGTEALVQFTEEPEALTYMIGRLWSGSRFFGPAKAELHPRAAQSRGMTLISSTVGKIKTRVAWRTSLYRRRRLPRLGHQNALKRSLVPSRAPAHSLSNRLRYPCHPVTAE